MTRQEAPYAPAVLARRGSVRLQDPAAAGGGPPRDGLVYQALGLPLNFQQMLVRRRRMEVADPQPSSPSWPTWGSRCAWTLNWQGRDYWVLVRQRRLDRGDTVLKLISGYVPAHELNLPLLTAIQKSPRNAWWRAAGGWLGGRFRRHLAADALLRVRCATGRTATSSSPRCPAPPVRCKPAACACWSAHAPTYTCPRPRCNWSNLHAPGAAARCARAEPLPCRRAARERSGWWRAWTVGALISTCCRWTRAPHQRPVHPAQGPVAPPGHPRPGGRELCRAGTAGWCMRNASVSRRLAGTVAIQQRRTGRRWARPRQRLNRAGSGCPFYFNWLEDLPSRRASDDEQLDLLVPSKKDLRVPAPTSPTAHPRRSRGQLAPTPRTSG